MSSTIEAITLIVLAGIVGAWAIYYVLDSIWQGNRLQHLEDYLGDLLMEERLWHKSREEHTKAFIDAMIQSGGPGGGPEEKLANKATSKKPPRKPRKRSTRK